MELAKAIKDRYSERDYREKFPSKEEIDLILESAWHAPNSCNMQAMHFLVIDDQELRFKMSKVATQKFSWAPVNILLMIDSRVTIKRHSGVMSLGAAMQNMLLTATDIGLAACPMAGFSNDESIKDLLGIPDYYDLMVVIGIGYPSTRNNSSKCRERIPLAESVHFNKFDSGKGISNLSVAMKDWSMEDVIDYRRRIAPVYRYENRFSLGIYSADIYEKLVEKINSITNFKNGKINVLDINTYDGVFIKKFIDINQDKINLTISDHLDHILKTRSDLGVAVETIKIQANNLIPSSKKFDLVTCVHKLQFIPNYATLLENSADLVKSDGYLVVAFDTQSRSAWFMKKIFLYAKSLFSGQIFNVYENNPYYKIGPYRAVPKKNIFNVLKRLKFSLVEDGIIKADNMKSSNRTYYAVFRKE